MNIHTQINYKRIFFTTVFILGIFSFLGCTSTVKHCGLPQVFKSSSNYDFPSFEQPPLRTPVAPFPKEMLYGTWTTTGIQNSKYGTIPQEHSVIIAPLTKTGSFLFNEDGTGVVTTHYLDKDPRWWSSVKNKTFDLTWEHNNNILTIHMKGEFDVIYTLNYTLLWYSNNTFEMRVDVKEYADYFLCPKVTFARFAYTNRGVLFGSMRVLNNNVNYNLEVLQTPAIYTRKQPELVTSL